MRFFLILLLLCCTNYTLADSERMASGKLVSTGMTSAEVIAREGLPTLTRPVDIPFTEQECYVLGITPTECGHRYHHHEEWLYQEKNRVVTLKLRDGKVFEIRSTIAR